MPVTESADIRFVYLDEGSDQAIPRSAKRVVCPNGDCFCRQGIPLADYIELFVWDPAAKQFRQAR